MSENVISLIDELRDYMDEYLIQTYNFTPRQKDLILNAFYEHIEDLQEVLLEEFYLDEYLRQ